MEREKGKPNQAWYKGKRVLITGGLGFIGSNLALRLAKAGAEITVMDSLIPQYGGNLFNVEPEADRIRVNVSDVRDRFSMNELVKDKEIMFNLAGTLSHIDSMLDPQTDLAVNCVSQLSILEACRQNNPAIRVLFAGTRGQYGKIQYVPVDERHPINPTDVNGINKHAGEQYHLLYHAVHGIKACSLRLTNTYGPRHQMKHHKQGIINWFVRLALDNKAISLFDGGAVKRDLTFIDDAVDAFLVAGQSESVWGNVYNVGGTSHTLKEIAETIVRLAGSGTVEFKTYPDDLKKIEIGSYEASYSKIQNELGWQPRIGMEEGMAQTIKYYRKHKEHYW